MFVQILLDVDGIVYKSYSVVKQYTIDYVAPGNHTLIVYAKDECGLVLTQKLWIFANLTTQNNTILKQSIDNILQLQSEIIENKDTGAFVTACTGFGFLSFTDNCNRKNHTK